jgi:hypothetical protein
MTKSNRPSLLRVGSAKRLTRGILPGLQVEEPVRPYSGG